MRTSKQREVVLEALRENVIHPTAENLYKIIKSKHSSIGTATVYRNLNSLVEDGLIKKIEGLTSSAHYDHNTHRHYHFICDKCNRVFDVSENVAPNLEEKAQCETGFQISGCDITFHGICTECINKERKND